MAKFWRLSAVQLTSGPEPAVNLAKVDQLLAQLPKAERHLAVLPEGVAVFAGPDGLNLQLAEALGAGPLQTAYADLAKKHQLYLLVGTLPTQTTDPIRFAASSLLYSPAGELIGDYQKIHLFDALVNDSSKQYLESATTMPGKKVSLVQLDELKLGMLICYDMRFPGLSQALAAQGMNVLAAPSAFTTVTGDAHWHTLLRARAIETQSFVVASAQVGTHINGRQTYGHSLIIDPWGRILAEADGSSEMVLSVETDLDLCQQLAEKMPVRHHNRFQSELKHE
ncbi:Putative amidohydrolase [Rheinheimera sp. A13L]|uniref:carbon-nitrogen hydrolase family protein n=1 Tax=Rheinheimera sp. A13L TaxID=506534 RepID=UPI0002124AA5|nr:carbon-nitrogen hydrolase family protein [Rheinheimera sp. A13L]EGM76624.1 Putative amidohydrolase [Rheinheimera sp. A13L]